MFTLTDQSTLSPDYGLRKPEKYSDFCVRPYSFIRPDTQAIIYQEWSSHWMIQNVIDVSVRILANDWITCSTMLETKYSTVSFLRGTKQKQVLGPDL